MQQAGKRRASRKVLLPASAKLLASSVFWSRLSRRGAFYHVCSYCNESHPSTKARTIAAHIIATGLRYLVWSHLRNNSSAQCRSYHHQLHILQAHHQQRRRNLENALTLLTKMVRRRRRDCLVSHCLTQWTPRRSMSTLQIPRSMKCSRFIHRQKSAFLGAGGHFSRMICRMRVPVMRNQAIWKACKAGGWEGAQRP